MEKKKKLLAEAQAAAEAVDVAFRKADFSMQLRLKPTRDAAIEAVSRARRELLESAVTISDKEVEEMAAIRGEITSAADKQGAFIAAAKIAVHIGKLLA